MFTIKLYRGHTIKIVQADSIEVFAAGPAAKMADDPKQRTNDVRELSAVNEGKGNQVFYICKQKCYADVHSSVYAYAYIENAAGATTEKIYPY